ncbi:hypothetical protein FQN54_002368 [Arachnomyces sp. PD_36]|nr:hypothetical protein FQN54_002368 [Arachnomyces sp. PD_36]
MASRGKWRDVGPIVNGSSESNLPWSPRALAQWQRQARDLGDSVEQPQREAADPVREEIASDMQLGEELHATRLYPQHPVGELEHLLSDPRTHELLGYYDRVICPHQIALHIDNTTNPYRELILPLAYRHPHLLYAVLGLAACHQGIQTSNESYGVESVQHQLKSIRALVELLGKEEDMGKEEQDALLVAIQVLVLHDICETGISRHGAHITGASSVSKRLLADGQITRENPGTVFFVANLAWLDVIRSFSDPDKLCFPWELLKAVADASDSRFELVNGCPRDIFLLVAESLWDAKHLGSGMITVGAFQSKTRYTLSQLRKWSAREDSFPVDGQSEWPLVGEAFRNVCILHVLRLQDPLRPPSDPEIQCHVNATLDATAGVPKSSPLLELLVLPLFIVGTETISRHGQYYVSARIDEIRGRSGFANPAPQDLLQKVWNARAEPRNAHKTNIMWNEFTKSNDMERQHDYIII